MHTAASVQKQQEGDLPAGDLANALDARELELVTRDVAARIVQLHWRAWRKRRHRWGSDSGSSGLLVNTAGSLLSIDATTRSSSDGDAPEQVGMAMQVPSETLLTCSAAGLPVLHAERASSPQLLGALDRGNKAASSGSSGRVRLCRSVEVRQSARRPPQGTPLHICHSVAGPPRPPSAGFSPTGAAACQAQEQAASSTEDDSVFTACRDQHDQGADDDGPTVGNNTKLRAERGNTLSARLRRSMEGALSGALAVNKQPANPAARQPLEALSETPAAAVSKQCALRQTSSNLVSSAPEPSATASVSAADKLLSLLGYLDAVEAEAEGQASAAAATALLPQQRTIAPASEALSGGVSGGMGACSALTHGEQQAQRSVPSGESSEQPCGENRVTALAESFFEGVRERLRGMEGEVAARDALLEQARADAQAAELMHAQELEASRVAAAEAVAAVQAECEEAAARQLAFIDRLLADKDELKQALAVAGEAVQATEARHTAAILALKDGWAAELRRQRDAWASTEAAKREAWAESKAAEIRGLTIKGLEVEVQRLIARHRSELAAAQEQAASDAAREADAMRARFEADLRHLRERMDRERNDAVERERAAAAARAQEAAERQEAALQALRAEHASDMEQRKTAAAAAAQEDRRRTDDAVAAAVEAAHAREATLQEQHQREMEAAARSHARALEDVRRAASDAQEAWRAALAEKLRREAADTERALRARLARERDEEVEVVIQRLEEESRAMTEAARAEAEGRHADQVAALESQLREARRGAERVADRLRRTEAAAAQAEAQAKAAASRADGLQSALGQRENAMAELMRAAQEARAEAATARDTASAEAGCAQDALAGRLQAAAADRALLEARLAQLGAELASERARHAAEMRLLEERVRSVVARKDEAIAALSGRLDASVARLQEAEGLLARGHESLCPTGSR